MAEPSRGIAFWRRKFARAGRGLVVGVRGESSFPVHFFTAAAVLLAASVLGLPIAQWAVLLLAITIVIAAELFNTALERLTRAVSRDHDPHLADALDTSSGAVLAAALGAASVGVLVFVHRLLALW